MVDCIFCKIINKSLTAQIIYEDDELMAFKDIHPKAIVHFLIIPKLHISSMLELTHNDSGLMGKALVLANELAIEQGLIKGYKTLINTGLSGGQEVFHLHMHIFGNP